MGRLRKIGLTVLRIIAALAILCIISRPLLTTRISGNVTVDMDGEVYILHPEDFSIIKNDYLSGNRLSVKENEDGSAWIGIKAGSKGTYAFVLQLEGIDKPIEISSFQFSYWNVVRFDLLIHIDRDAGIVNYECTAYYFEEDGNRHQVNQSRTQNLSEECLYTCILFV